MERFVDLLAAPPPTILNPGPPTPVLQLEHQMWCKARLGIHVRPAGATRGVDATGAVMGQC